MDRSELVKSRAKKKKSEKKNVATKLARIVKKKKITWRNLRLAKNGLN